MANISIEQFEKEALAFLESNAERRPVEKAFVWGEGSDNFYREKDREQEAINAEEGKIWRQKKFDAGYGWITGPEAYGGRQLPPAYDRLYNQLEATFRVPDQSVFAISLGMVTPTILDHGSQTARDLYVRKLWRGEMIASQLFSEPGAGSDLASLTTKAVKDGDEWVITGQKVWTTGAHYSDIGEIMTRTDWNLPKHKGLTAFIIDFKDPNVEVRPLKQMTGGASFNEIFFNEVRVKDDHRLGDVNNGWNVALTTLMNERASIGSNNAGDNNLITRVIAMVKHYGLESDPLIRHDLADIVMNYRIANMNAQRATAKAKAGQLPGPEGSIGKMVLVNNQARLVKFISHVLGPKLIADSGEWGTFAWANFVLGTPGLRIAGGSDEVMRNIVGERVLGLPKDMGIDSRSPFKDIKVS
ncbi:MAG: acyl-CoA dehydrogenase family protein [Actinobacteria bacterium]|jgi:acyl-CoA dehydrogenase|nr:MAG: putative acyl-CoA dehydrogenase [actinobacterium acAcidi]MCX6517740.1 acyl-CoA dehydrogenase family protein [Actinomycetota bacterium]